MRSRLYLFVLAAVIAIAAPAFAQRGTAPGDTEGGMTGQQVPTNGNVTARVFTSAVLADPAGNVIGKVKTATVQTTDRGVVQGLRVQLTGVTPNSEFALVIDGTLVGTATSSATGVLRFKFISPTNGRTPAIPDAVLPIALARTVQIFSAATQSLVASGEFRRG